MPKAIAMIENGTEEVECLAVADVLRRAGADVALVSGSEAQIVGSHGIRLIADGVSAQTDLTDCDLLFIPGGMPGSKRLAENKKLIDAISVMLDGGKRVAAICAAPSVVLGENGFLRGKKAVCFPGFESGMLGAQVQTGARVVTDGNVTTARGMGCAVELGLELVRLLFGASKADEIKDKIQF